MAEPFAVGLEAALHTSCVHHATTAQDGWCSTTAEGPQPGQRHANMNLHVWNLCGVGRDLVPEGVPLGKQKDMARLVAARSNTTREERGSSAPHPAYRRMLPGGRCGPSPVRHILGLSCWRPSQPEAIEALKSRPWIQ